MAQLCERCQEKPQPPQTMHGTCRAQASPDCETWTDDFAFALCDECAEVLEACYWCGDPLSGWHVDVPTDKEFVRVFDNDNGIHIAEVMRTGMQVCVQLVVDLYSGYVLQFNRRQSSREVSLHAWRMIRDPRDYRTATIEIYVNLNDATESAKIVIDEALDDRFWWWRPPKSSNRSWQCTVEIRR